MTPKDTNLNVDDALFMAFVGLYMRGPEGEFVSLDDKYGVLKDSLKKELLAILLAELPPKHKNLKKRYLSEELDWATYCAHIAANDTIVEVESKLKDLFK